MFGEVPLELQGQNGSFDTYVVSRAQTPQLHVRGLKEKNLIVKKEVDELRSKQVRLKVGTP